MILVLDSSAGIEISLRRPHSKILQSYIESAQLIISSDLYKAETANVIWKYVNAGIIKKENAGTYLDLTLGLVDQYIDISDNNTEALYEAIAMNHSSYDLLFLTLARRRGAKLLSLDKKLTHCCLKQSVDVFNPLITMDNEG